MRKTLAAVGAAVLGIAAVAATSGTAQAASTTKPTCATAEDAATIHTGNPAAAAIYTDCVPLYGAGKAELSLSGSGDMSDFSLGDEADVSGVYSELPPAAVDAYEGSPDAHQQISTPLRLSADSYFVTTTSRITSFVKIPVSALSAKCNAATVHYDAAYRFSFAPVHATIQTTAASGQLVDDAPGSFTVSKAVPQLTLGLNFAEGVVRNDTSTDHFDADAAQCATFNGAAVYAPSSADAESAWSSVVSAAITQSWTQIGGLALGPSTLAPGLKTAYVTAAASGHAGVDATVTATVEVGTTYQPGVITVDVDGKRLKTQGALTGGKLTLTLPHALKPGAHTVALTYPGGPGALPTTATKSLLLQK